MPFSNINNPDDPPTNTTAVLSGGINYIIPYVPTAMDKSPGGNPVDLDNYRSRNHVFFRGYKENISFVPNNGQAWLWRRVCFTMKGSRIYSNTLATTPLALETSPNGWVRTLTNANGSLLGDAIVDVLFKGAAGIDWNSPYNATIDTDNVTLMYDKTRVFRGGNGESRIHNVRLWHPINKNFIYDNEEDGDDENQSIWHTEGKAGMGDFYIVDFIVCSSSSTSATMQMIPNGRIYWHER